MNRRLNVLVIIGIALLNLFVISILSLSYGDSSIGFIQSFEALFGFGQEASIKIVQNIRLPRVVAGLIAGSTLALSGMFTRISLNNPLADSSVLGIQSGATVVAMLCILVFPFLSPALPLFAFLGGLAAYFLVIMFSYDKGFNSIRLILSGVAVNSFFIALTNIISINHINELQGTIQWTSGSLVGISNNDVGQMLFYAIIVFIISFLCLPILNMLQLEDDMLISLGKNPNLYRLISSIVAVMLASVSLAYVGPIAFIGIIAPHISDILIKNSIKYKFILTIIIGAILVVGADLLGRVIFKTEMPVGAIIGILGAPLFLYLLRGDKSGI